MTVRRFGEHMQRDDVRQVPEFTAFLGLPSDRAEPEDLRRYQLHLASLGPERGPAARGYLSRVSLVGAEAAQESFPVLSADRDPAAVHSRRLASAG